MLRVSYGRTAKAETLLRERHIETYSPLHRVVRMVRGKRRRVQLPLLPGFIFVRSEAKALEIQMKEPEVHALVTYYYNHFRQTEYGLNPPLVIPDREMNSFITALTADSYDVRIVKPEHVHYKSGDLVRVTVGRFKGVEGRVARAAGQQRVIINLQGLCLVATAFVPTGCLEIVAPAGER